MPKDKIYYRRQGKSDAITRQPVGGRAQGGGLKIGEIIKDSEGGFRVMPKVIFERLEFLRLIDFLPKSLENHTPYDRSSETKVNFQ